MDPEIIAHPFPLSKHFTPHVLINDEPKIEFHGLKKNIRFLSIRGSKSYLVGTHIIFSGKNLGYLYKLLKTQNFDWRILKFGQQTLRLGRIDLYFSRTDYLNHISKSFDRFLVDSPSQI